MSPDFPAGWAYQDALGEIADLRSERDELIRLLRVAYEAHPEQTRGFAGSTRIRDILERGATVGPRVGQGE